MTRSTPSDGMVARLGSVGKSFGRVVALDSVTTDVKRGEILAVIGRNGAGKSTLIRCLAGLEKPCRGRVEVLGQDIVRLPDRSVRKVRARIGTIFGHFNPLPAKTVAGNVVRALKAADVSAAERTVRGRELLALVGLSDKAAACPASLSAGQRRRVDIARALAADPALLLCDDAISALDPEAALSVLDLLRAINRRLGLTIVLTTREMNLARTVADRLIVLDEGRIVEEGEVWRVLTAPETALTQRLIGSQTSELPAAVRNGLQNEWGRGTHLVLRVHLSGDDARTPVLARLTRDLGVLPVVLSASVQHVREQALASFIVAFSDAGESLARHVGEYLASRVSRLEVLGYVHRLT